MTIDQSKIDEQRTELYATGYPVYLKAATDQPLEILRRASDNAARAVADYRRAVKASANYAKVHPGIQVPDTTQLSPGAIALPNPASPDIEKARRKLTRLEAEVEQAEAGVRRASSEVRTALGVGTRYLREDETHPMLQQLSIVERELNTGAPQLKRALTSAKAALEDPAGGVDLADLPGWEQDQVIHIAESAYTPEEPEKSWYNGLGGVWE